MNPRSSALIQNLLPPKENDPGSFILSCSIGRFGSEEFEDPDGCGESKENKIVGTVLNKLHDEWFKGTDEDDDDLE
ncbi:hypothetical protein Tco_0801303 [Tanacetum coccineum]|uniref:Uncharacterized protein n=1 Tax=Tanacetum coccineum TaxID=301880 RepID=A0ABQ4ZVL0_9ASTR